MILGAYKLGVLEQFGIITKITSDFLCVNVGVYKVEVSELFGPKKIAHKKNCDIYNVLLIV